MRKITKNRVGKLIAPSISGKIRIRLNLKLLKFKLKFEVENFFPCLGNRFFPPQRKEPDDDQSNTSTANSFYSFEVQQWTVLRLFWMNFDSQKVTCQSARWMLILRHWADRMERNEIQVNCSQPAVEWTVKFLTGQHKPKASY